MEELELTHWCSKNPEYAAAMILHQVRGYLKVKGDTISTQELINYIEEELATEIARLDKQYPEKKARQPK